MCMLLLLDTTIHFRSNFGDQIGELSRLRNIAITACACGSCIDCLLLFRLSAEQRARNLETILKAARRRAEAMRLQTGKLQQEARELCGTGMNAAQLQCPDAPVHPAAMYAPIATYSIFCLLFTSCITFLLLGLVSTCTCFCHAYFLQILLIKHTNAGTKTAQLPHSYTASP